MQSREYKIVIATIVRKVFKKKYPKLDKNDIKNMSAEIARAIHARMYGANVDSVASPIWRSEGDQYPNVDAIELLKEESFDEKNHICNGYVAK